MVYAKGVDDNCYNDPSSCTTAPWESYTEQPEKGWIYNSNGLEEQYELWLLTPYVANSDCVFYITPYGFLNGYGSSSRDYKIRPVVYLKSSINIISGEGTEQNPYVLE